MRHGCEWEGADRVGRERRQGGRFGGDANYTRVRAGLEAPRGPEVLSRGQARVVRTLITVVVFLRSLSRNTGGTCN